MAKQNNISKKSQKAAKKWFKNLHPTTKFLMILVLIGSIAAAFLVGNILQKNDQFTLIGETTININVGGSYQEPELNDAVKCVVFGSDISASVTINEEESTYDPLTSINTPGIYYIVYETTNFKFSKIKRIRTIIVNEVEINEDGIGD